MKKMTSLIVMYAVLNCHFVESKELLKQVVTGSTPLYKYNDQQLQDLSGAAYNNGKIYLASDGGKNSDFPDVRVTSLANLQKPARLLQRQIFQRDIEGATQAGNFIYLTSSMSQVDEDTEDYRVLAELRMNDDGSIFSERYIYAREMIISAMAGHFGDSAWLRRVKISFGKNGGLNIEGLSVSHINEDTLVFGFRSPLWDVNFGSPELQSDLSLSKGKAILMSLTAPFKDKNQAASFTLLDLGGKGIRGLEYIPQLKGYVIISGPVEKGNDYGLWFYEPTSEKTTSLTKKGDLFFGLCRPEAILNIPERRTLLVLSEESGSACDNAKFNYVEYQY